MAVPAAVGGTLTPENVAAVGASHVAGRRGQARGHDPAERLERRAPDHDPEEAHDDDGPRQFQAVSDGAPGTRRWDDGALSTLVDEDRGFDYFFPNQLREQVDGKGYEADVGARSWKTL